MPLIQSILDGIKIIVHGFHFQDIDGIHVELNHFHLCQMDSMQVWNIKPLKKQMFSMYIIWEVVFVCLSWHGKIIVTMEFTCQFKALFLEMGHSLEGPYRPIQFWSPFLDPSDLPLGGDLFHFNTRFTSTHCTKKY